MRYQLSNKYTPRMALCPSCAQIMRFAQKASRGDLPNLAPLNAELVACR